MLLAAILILQNRKLRLGGKEPRMPAYNKHSIIIHQMRFSRNFKHTLSPSPHYLNVMILQIGKMAFLIS